MDNDLIIQTYDTEEQTSQTTYKNDISDEEQKGPIMLPQDGSNFLTTLIFACKAVIACARQLNIMEQEHSNGNYGTALSHSADAIILAIKKDKILATRPALAFAQISEIIETEVGDFTEARMYSLIFNSIAKSFLRFPSDEQLTANIWLIVLTSVNKMLAKNTERSLGTTLDALICAEHKLREALNLGLNPVHAFGEVVNATEMFALQTVHMAKLHSTNLTNHKTYKYPDPGAHAVCVWMRAAYEAVKLKYSCKYSYNV